MTHTRGLQVAHEVVLGATKVQIDRVWVVLPAIIVLLLIGELRGRGSCGVCCVLDARGRGKLLNQHLKDLERSRNNGELIGFCISG